MALGAQLWHMDGQTMSCGYFHGIKVPDFETTFVAPVSILASKADFIGRM